VFFREIGVETHTTKLTTQTGKTNKGQLALAG
jgi:hypothetical protein